MTVYLKQSTASQEILLGPFMSSTDGITAVTGLTIANTDIKIWKAGGTTVGNKNSGGATEISGGYYYAVLDATDTDTLGSLIITVNVSTALMLRLECAVLAAETYDAWFGTAHLATATALATVDGIVDDILVDTAVIGALGAGLTGIPWNAAWDAEVQSEVADALAVYDPPTNAEMEARTIVAANYATAAALTTVDDFLDTEVAAILADTNELQTDLTNGGRLDLLIDAIKAVTDAIGATGSGLSAIPWNAAWDAEVQSECTDALNAYDPPTKAELDTGLDALPTAAEIKTAIEAAGSHLALILEDTGTTLPATLTTIDDFLDTEIAAILADTNELQTDWTNGGRLDLLIDAILEDTGTTLDTKLNTIDDFLDTEVAAILADTNELQTDWANGGRLDLILDAASAPSAAAVADAVWDEALSGHVGSGTAGAALATASSGGVDTAVLADAIWDEAMSGHVTAGSAGKALADVLEDTATTLPAAIDTIDNFLDTEIAAILEDTGTTLPASLSALDTKIDTIDNFLDTEVAAILADTNELQTDWVNGGRLDLLIDAIKAKTDLVALASVCTEMRLAQLDEANIPSDLDNTFDDIGDVKTVVDAILVDTGTTLPATLTTIEGKIDTIDNFLDTEVAAILEDTGTTLPATLATIDGLVDDIKALVGGYSLASPVFDDDGNMTSATITANGKTFTVTATYDVDTNLATYSIVEA